LGVPIISSDGEAEALCVKLAKEKYVDYVFTEDSDAFPYATSMLSETNNNAKDIKILKKGSQYNKFYEYSTNEVLKLFKFTNDQFLDFCILSGCDYSSTIPKIGPITSYKLIKEHNTIENCLDFIKKGSKYNIPDDFNYVESRSIFKNPSVSIPEDLDFFSLEPVDISNLKTFLTEEKGMNPQTIIFKYMKSYKEFENNFNTSSTGISKNIDSYLSISAESFREDSPESLIPGNFPNLSSGNSDQNLEKESEFLADEESVNENDSFMKSSRNIELVKEVSNVSS
jgi:5'-3' exonuclease